MELRFLRISGATEGCPSPPSDALDALLDREGSAEGMPRWAGSRLGPNAVEGVEAAQVSKQGGGPLILRRINKLVAGVWKTIN